LGTDKRDGMGKDGFRNGPDDDYCSLPFKMGQTTEKWDKLWTPSYSLICLDPPNIYFAYFNAENGDMTTRAIWRRGTFGVFLRKSQELFLAQKQTLFL
jgi:hypothetical protein